MGWTGMMALVIIGIAAALVFGVWFINHCRGHEEPNLHNWTKRETQ